MHCAGFEARLNELLDDRRRPECDDELLAHAETCDSCREDLALSEQLFAGLEMSHPPLVRKNFARDVVAEVMGALPVEVPLAEMVEPRRRGNRALLWRIAGTVVAASLLLALVPLANRLGREPNQPAPLVVDDANPADPPPPTALVNAQPATHAPVTPAATSDAIPASVYVNALYENLPDVPVEKSVNRFPGLRPVATSVGLTIGVVRRTIPGQSTQSRPPAGDENKSPAPSKPQAEFSRDLFSAGLV
jgi:hypothetical protein